MEPLHLLPKIPPTHEGSGQSRSRIGPDLGGDRVLVSMGSVRHGRPLKIWGPLGLARLATLDFSRFFQEPSALKQLSAEGRALEDFWTTYYVDLDAGTLVATFDGFRVLPKRIETPSGPEAWLVDDERGMPYRFHPKRLDPQNPISSLEPVFRPPWDDE